MKKRTLIYIITAVSVALIILLSYFISMPYTLNSRGMIYPLKEWTLAKTTDGNLINVLKNYESNVIENYSVTEFIRGDASAFRLDESILTRKRINKGDTIAYIISNEDQLRLLEIEGELETEKAMLNINASGSKPEDIKHQEEVVKLALDDFLLQEKIFQRINQLYMDSMISKNDFDVAYNELKTKEHNHTIANAELLSLKTGMKAEQIEYNKKLITSLENQATQLRQRLSNNIIRSPINGIIVKLKSGNTDNNGNLVEVENIIRVIDQSRFLAILPIELNESMHIEVGTKVNLTFNNNDLAFEGRIIEIDNTIQLIKRREVVFTTVVIEDNIEVLSMNMIADATFDCGEITLFEYFKRVFNTVTQN